MHIASVLQGCLDRVVPSPALFDKAYYLATYPDMRSYKGSLYSHYQKFGWREGRFPTPLFDSKWYSDTYLNGAPDQNPLEHYEQVGWKLGFNPSAVFDAKWFRETHMSGRSDRDPLAFYIESCATAGISPHPLLNISAYLNDNREVPKDAMDALNHILREGYHGVRAAVPGFDPEHYRSKNPETAGLSDPETWKHFLVHGRKTHGVFWPSEAVMKARVAPRPNSPTSTEQQSPMIIAGFHRSGTSLTSNLLLNAGLYLGDRLLGANYSNPRGHFEDVEVISFHNRLLANAGRDWMVSDHFEPIVTAADISWMRDYGTRRAGIGAWGFKDPRSTLFLSQWTAVFPSSTILYIHRPCIECVHSIKRRAANWLRLGIDTDLNARFWTQEDLAVKMYLTYAETALEFLEQFSGRSCVVALDDILKGRNIVRQINEHWGYDLKECKISDIFDTESMSRVGPNEYIHDKSLLARIEDVESRFSALAERGFGPAVASEEGAQ
ncbi:hypothetical protein SAMN05444851_0112 [Aliiroseovarius sediminilitoris]|uniref:Sulfotransferase family protein n=2 Tax=Aliiroseovarius sediminilitoris TaxID=1173584 RepID=A0A1I0MLM6_9RHOB|nr:hypothetical protein SAMN05444851_0112 [Aliiroseovarius sediminilitoris]